MGFFSYIILLLIFASPLHAEERFAHIEGGLTLRRCFELALERSDTLAMSGEEVKKAEAAYRQVIGKALPGLSFRYAAEWQDKEGLVDIAGIIGENPAQTGAFQLTLPMFSGYRELSAIKAGSSLIRQKKEERAETELLLANDVAKAFYAAILAEENLKTLGKTLQLAKARRAELATRAAIGRSREAEVLDTEAGIAYINAQKEDAILNVSTARNLLEFLMGVPANGPLIGSFSTTTPGTEDIYISRISNRPNVRAKREAVKVATGSLRNAISGHLPQLDASANYFVKRAGIQEPVDWDVTLGVTVPIWTWGKTQGEVRWMKAALKQAKRDAELSARKGELEIKDAYDKFSSYIEKERLQKRALDLAAESYHRRIDEYEKGLINNIEALQSLERLYQNEILYNAARFESQIGYFLLETSTGSLPEEVR